MNRPLTDLEIVKSWLLMASVPFVGMNADPESPDPASACPRRSVSADSRSSRTPARGSSSCPDPAAFVPAQVRSPSSVFVAEQPSRSSQDAAPPSIPKPAPDAAPPTPTTTAVVSATTSTASLSPPSSSLTTDASKAAVPSSTTVSTTTAAAAAAAAASKEAVQRENASAEVRVVLAGSAGGSGVERRPTDSGIHTSQPQKL